MKKTILVAVLTLLMVSCATTKKRQTSTTLEIASQAKITENVQITADATQSKTTEIADNTLTTVEEFDTTKPTDPQTGTPPLKKRTTTKNKKSSNVQEVANQQSKTNGNKVTSTGNKEKATSDLNDENKPSTNGWDGFKIGLLVAFILLSIIIISWKILKKRLKPL